MSTLRRWISPSWAYRRIYEQTIDPWLLAYLSSQALFSRELVHQVSPIASVFRPEVFLQRFYQLSHIGQGLSGQMYLDVKTLLCDREILPHDRLSAISQTPWSSPFLAEDIVTYMASVPDEQKWPLEEQNPLHSLLNPTIANLPFRRRATRTSGFLDTWINDAGLQRMWSLLLDGSLVESGWVSRKWLRQALERRTKPPVTFQQLWGLLVLEVWFQLYINRPITLTPPTLTASELLR